MGREDQTEEREVLDSIFPDEITGETLLLLPHDGLYVWENSSANLDPPYKIYPRPHTEYPYLSRLPKMTSNNPKTPSSPLST